MAAGPAVTQEGLPRRVICYKARCKVSIATFCVKPVVMPVVEVVVGLISLVINERPLPLSLVKS